MEKKRDESGREKGKVSMYPRSCSTLGRLQWYSHRNMICALYRYLRTVWWNFVCSNVTQDGKIHALNGIISDSTPRIHTNFRKRRKQISQSIVIWRRCTWHPSELSRNPVQIQTVYILGQLRSLHSKVAVWRKSWFEFPAFFLLKRFCRKFHETLHTLIRNENKLLSFLMSYLTSFLYSKLDQR